MDTGLLAWYEAKKLPATQNNRSAKRNDCLRNFDSLVFNKVTNNLIDYNADQMICRQKNTGI